MSCLLAYYLLASNSPFTNLELSPLKIKTRTGRENKEEKMNKGLKKAQVLKKKMRKMYGNSREEEKLETKPKRNRENKRSRDQYPKLLLEKNYI